jgi:hypothetical protein
MEQLFNADVAREQALSNRDTVDNIEEWNRIVALIKNAVNTGYTEVDVGIQEVKGWSEIERRLKSLGYTLRDPESSYPNSYYVMW